MNCFETMPDRTQDTLFLASVFGKARGLQTAVANLFGCAISAIQQQLDSKNTTHAWFAQFKRFQWSVDVSDLETGDAIWNNLSEDRRRWREAITAEKRIEVDVDRQCGALGKELVEFVQSRLLRQSRSEQIAELDDVIRVAQETRDALKREEESSRFRQVSTGGTVA